MSRLREFFGSRKGRAVATGVLLCSVATLAWSAWAQMRSDPTVELANSPLFIDAENGKTFRATLAPGTMLPVTSPFTGHASGYEAELCYWSKEGKPQPEPTPVLLREYLHARGPTFCPVCGRLVVHHNPPATAARRPPPTQAEYAATHPGETTPIQDSK